MNVEGNKRGWRAIEWWGWGEVTHIYCEWPGQASMRRPHLGCNLKNSDTCQDLWSPLSRLQEFLLFLIPVGPMDGCGIHSHFLHCAVHPSSWIYGLRTCSINVLTDSVLGLQKPLKSDENILHFDCKINYWSTQTFHEHTDKTEFEGEL